MREWTTPRPLRRWQASVCFTWGLQLLHASCSGLDTNVAFFLYVLCKRPLLQDKWQATKNDAHGCYRKLRRWPSIPIRISISREWMWGRKGWVSFFHPSILAMIQKEKIYENDACSPRKVPRMLSTRMKTMMRSSAAIRYYLGMRLTFIFELPSHRMKQGNCALCVEKSMGHRLHIIHPYVHFPSSMWIIPEAHL